MGRGTHVTSPLAPSRVTDPALSSQILTLSVLDTLRLGADAGAAFLVAGDREYPLTELLGTIERRACGIVAAGLRPGDRVGVWLPSSLEAVLWMYAVIAAGGSAVLVPPRATAAEAHRLDGLARSRWTIGPLSSLTFITHQEALAKFDRGAKVELPAVEAQTEAVCFTTSGSTGTPKLTALSHRSFAANIIASQIVVGGDTDEPVLFTLPVCHVAVLHSVHFALVQGRRVAFLPEFNAQGVVQLARDTGAAYMSGSPAIYGLMLQRCSLPDPQLRFRRISYGSGAMPAHWSAEIGTALGCEVVNLYGVTEGGGIASVLPPELAAVKPGSVGALLPPFDGVTIRDEHWATLPAGEVGEICLKGPGCMMHYVANPEETALTINEGWVRTGDLGRLDADGDLWVTGRVKDQINRGGLKIGAREVESVIERLPGVTGVGVVAVHDDLLGERVGAAVEIPGGGVDAEAVRAACAAALSDYKVPERIVILDAMPRTPMGKPDKPAIRKLMHLCG